ncbi:DUF72 domain-containing protein [Methanocella sp. CWC-04]|uniref:DUF72 domain-containing protein n=1 Tax=Methanooceanicella nereidis TaxID=2052831 RepID=A0AAP2RBZ5_9EURY|nr:DUF72 domain-containing protein [Methanocella sp. CWC-04]MCD1294548.1 DUF72 domain-containing protein [Methanocella sp. CWC-04]
MPVLIGTSGWSYDDWVGTFYPPHLKKEEWLSYYARFFKTTEINSTYYSFPTAAVVNSWISKASGFSGFEYSVKFPKRVTHDSLLSDVSHALEFEEKVLSPLSDSGYLGGVLIQLSPYFKMIDEERTTDHLSRLQSLLESLDTKKFDYAIEFRHRSWLEDKGLNAGVRDLLQRSGVAVCAVDGPSMPGMIEDTADHAYIRFHGRNPDIWYGKDRDMKGRMNRYDYVYREEELAPWKGRLGSLKAKGAVRVYFNNHPRANAVKNAMMFETMLGLKEKQEVPHIAAQSSLSSYFDQ